MEPMNGNCGGMWQALVCCGKRCRRRGRRVGGFIHSTNEANESSRNGVASRDESRRDELNRWHQQRRALNVLYLRARQTTSRRSPTLPSRLLRRIFYKAFGEIVRNNYNFSLRQQQLSYSKRFQKLTFQSAAAARLRFDCTPCTVNYQRALRSIDLNVGKVIKDCAG